MTIPAELEEYLSKLVFVREGNELRTEQVSTRAMDILESHNQARFLASLVEEYLSPFGSWKGKMYEVIGRALMKEDLQLVMDGHKRFAFYVQLENVSLLELAVWKFSCVTMKDEYDDTNGESTRSYLEWKIWDESGWKAYKKRQTKLS